MINKKAAFWWGEWLFIDNVTDDDLLCILQQLNGEMLERGDG